MPAAGAIDEGGICEREDGIIVETVVKFSSDIDGDADVVDWIVLDNNDCSIPFVVFLMVDWVGESRPSDFKCDADIVDRIVLDNIDCSKLEVYCTFV